MAESDFLIPKPMEDGADLSYEWTRFLEEFELYLVATEKDKKADKIRIALMLRCIGPRGIDIFKSFTFTGGKSIDKYSDVTEKFQAFCLKTSNKIIKRHQLLSTKQGCMTIDEYVTSLHKIARECSLEAMYDDFFLQALLLGINDEEVKRKLFEADDNLTLDQAIKKCKMAEASKNDMKSLKGEESVHALQPKGKLNKPYKGKQNAENFDSRSKAKCGNCGSSHQPKKCPAYGQQCHGCGKYNHFRKLCRSARQVHHLTDADIQSGNDSDESLLCLQVIRSNKKLLSTIETHSKGRHVKILYQLDTGASCNILNYQDYCALQKPSLKNHRPDLKLFDGSTTKPLGQCQIQMAGRTYNCYVVKTNNLSLLSGDTCLDLGLLSIKHEWVNMVSTATTVEQLTEEYADVFQGVGCLPGDYHIELDKDAIPIKNSNRKVPVSMLADLKTKLESLEQNQLVKKVDYPTDWLNNMVAVRKPSGKLRVCLDPSNLNKVIKRNHFPMPTLDDVLVELADAKVFSLCDAKDGFLQIKLDEVSSDLTTFWTPYGKYKWLRMAFGLVSSSEEFQRRLSEALNGLTGITVVADDILIYGKGDNKEQAMNDHNQNLEKLLIRAREVNLKLNKDKCRFLLQELPYIGHIITEHGIKPDPKKVNAIREMAHPKDGDGVRRFLGHINYVSKFIPDCSAESEPLRRLINVTDDKFVWGEDQINAFDRLKELLTHEKTLKYFRVNYPIVVQTDASTGGLGAVLMQDGKPVCYASRSLTDSEQNYAPIELELLAIVYAMQKFDQYVFGCKDLTVHTDHEPLEPILKKSLLKAPKRLQSMLLALQRYPMSVKYRPGPLQVTADMLSRSPVDKSSPGVNEEQIFQIQSFLSDLSISQPRLDLPVSESTYKSIQANTRDDDELKLIGQLIMDGWPLKASDLPEIARCYHSFRDELAVLDGILYKGPRIIVPKASRLDILKKLHVSHQGTAATLRRARGVVFWPQMSEDIRVYTEKCVKCAMDSPAQQKETLQNHDIPNKPWSKVGMDLLTYHNKHYLVIVDYFSDFFECEPITNLSSAGVIKVCKRTFARYGIPDVVQSDNGPQFASSDFTIFGQKWGFQHTTSSPGHQQSNGKAEAAVKIIKRLMRRADDPYLALLEYRNTPTAEMSTSPAERMLGHSTRSILPTPNKNKTVYMGSVLPEKSKKKLMTQDSYNQSAKDLKPLVVGEPVLLRDFSAAKDKYNKWMTGKVLERLSDRSYTILNDDTGNIIRRNRIDIRNSPSRDSDQSSTLPVLQQPQSPNISTEDALRLESNREKSPVSHGVPPQLDATVRRSTTRERKLPIRFKDYEMR